MPNAKFDFAGIDIRTIDPEKIDIGLNGQDCALIAQTFERGANYTPSEAAIFATLSRNLQNHSKIVDSITASLESYLQVPQQALDAVAQQSAQFATGAMPPSGEGTPAQSLGIADQVTYGDKGSDESFGHKALEHLKECIPCSLRPIGLFELKPSADLLKNYEDYLKNLFGTLSSMTDFLKSQDFYGDLCSLIDALSFMCVPDLQRILVLLMSSFMQGGSTLTAGISFLQAIVAPLFASVLLALTGLFDRLNTLVAMPVKCVRDMINSMLAVQNKLIPSTNPLAGTMVGTLNGLDSKIQKPGESQAFESSLQMLSAEVDSALRQFQAKLAFYVEQVKAMLGDMGSMDLTQMQAKFRNLRVIRMIAFIRAIVLALSRGRLECSPGQSPSGNEVANFMDEFLSPTSPFTVWIDDNGLMHLDEKDQKTIKPLSEMVDMLQSEGKPLVSPDILETATSISQALSEPIRVALPCRLEQTSPEQATKLNAWMTELNQL